MIDRSVRRYVKTRFLQNRFSKVDREFWLFSWLTISIVYILIAILYKLQRIVDDLVKEWMRCATTVHLVVLLWGKIRRSPRGLWGFLGLHSAFSSPRRGRAPRFVSLHSYSMPSVGTPVLLVEFPLFLLVSLRFLFFPVSCQSLDESLSFLLSFSYFNWPRGARSNSLWILWRQLRAPLSIDTPRYLSLTLSVSVALSQLLAPSLCSYRPGRFSPINTKQDQQKQYVKKKPATTVFFCHESR